MKRKKEISLLTFKPYPDAEARKRSAITLVKYLLEAKNREILLRHRRALLNVLLWKITEAESPKYKTRFRSQGVLDCGGKGKLQHDHVFQRKKMVDELVKAKPHKVDGIVKNAIGCAVTHDEHTRLSEFKEYDGWVRYQKARIAVTDMKTNKRIRA
jgi:hypothetical protein